MDLDVLFRRADVDPVTAIVAPEIMEKRRDKVFAIIRS
jgi:hypothetical protein